MFKKKILYWITLVVLFSIFSAAKIYTAEISNPISPQPSKSPQGEVMTVHFLDVGQADSIFIDFGSYEILVDGGNNGDGPYVSDYIQPYVDASLDLVVATHAHEDHIGGLGHVISSYQTDHIVYSDEVASTRAFQDFYETAASEPDCTFSGDSDMIFNMGGGAQFIILEMGDGFRNPNENSVVSMIDYNEVEILLTGDLESNIEKKNLTKFRDIDVLKVGHHGSGTASSQAFLDVIRPEVSIISAGLDNRYSLPNAEIISRLNSMNSTVYGTFRSGDIILTTDGVQYHVTADIPLTPDDAGAASVQKPIFDALALKCGALTPSLDIWLHTLRKACIRDAQDFPFPLLTAHRYS